MSRNQRLSFLGIAAVIAVVAIIVLTTGGSDDTSTDDSANTAGQQTATATATPTAADGGDATPTPTPTAKPKPVVPLLVAGKIAELRYKEGETVGFRVRSDKPEEVHVHGYDIKKDVGAGETVNVAFKGDITGIFEIEFEDSAQQIAELRVDPK